MKLIILAVVAVVLIVLILVGVTYNGLVRRRNGADNAWAQVGVQLKRRYDLIPNLVDTVQGYASHERSVFEEVAQARAAAINAHGPAAQAQAENALSGALKNLFAVAESYPELKASENFLNLQGELSDTENRIAYARQYYNDAVMGYNNATQTLPTNIVAGLTGFKSRELYDASDTEIGPVRVSFR